MNLPAPSWYLPAAISRAAPAAGHDRARSASRGLRALLAFDSATPRCPQLCRPPRRGQWRCTRCRAPLATLAPSCSSARACCTACSSRRWRWRSTPQVGLGAPDALFGPPVWRFGGNVPVPDVPAQPCCSCRVAESQARWRPAPPSTPCAGYADKVLRLLRCNKWRERAEAAIKPPGKSLAPDGAADASYGHWARSCRPACLARDPPACWRPPLDLTSAARATPIPPCSQAADRWRCKAAGRGAAAGHRHRTGCGSLCMCICAGMWGRGGQLPAQPGWPLGGPHAGTGGSSTRST